MEMKTLSPDQYLAQRSAELDEIEASLNRKLTWLRAERERLVLMAEGAGLQRSFAVGADQDLAHFRTATSQRGVRVHAGTMKAAAVAVLRKADRGLTARELLPLINQHLGTEYPRSSLSPQLSRLKREGFITLEGSVWMLTPENEKASDRNAGEQSSEAFQSSAGRDREAGQGGGT